MLFMGKMFLGHLWKKNEMEEKLNGKKKTKQIKLRITKIEHFGGFLKLILTFPPKSAS